MAVLTSNDRYRNLNTPTFWEDVKPSNLQSKPAFMTFDDAWVDEVARGVKACAVFAFYPLFWLAYNQIDSNLTSQAATMELHGTPNDLINNLNPLGIVIMIPILDQLVYPMLRRARINFSPLKRMGSGFFIACSAMVWAAVVQSQIYAKGACGKYMNTCDIPAAPLNVWIQAGAVCDPKTEAPNANRDTVHFSWSSRNHGLNHWLRVCLY